MRPRIRLSLVSKFFLAFVLVVSAGIGTVSLMARSAAEREVRFFMDLGGFDDLQRVADYLSAYYQGRGSWQGVEPLFSGEHMIGSHMTGPLSRGFMNRMRSAGLTLADSSGLVIAGEHHEVGSEVLGSELSAAIPIIVDGETIGFLFLDDEAPLGPDENFLMRVGQSLFLAALVAGSVALVVGGLLVFNLLRPVRDLTSAARALAKGDLSMRVPVRGADELGDLSHAFNQMAGNLERAETLRQEVTADIAHELRNPLAVIQARLEAILDNVNPATPENIEVVLEQSRLLNRLVDDLRTLALADAGELDLHRTEVDLAALLRRVSRNHADQAQAKGVDFHFDAGEAKEIKVSVDPFRLEQVVVNLLSNALRHAPRSGEVILKVSAGEDAGAARIEVLDNGEGIPEEAMENVFVRFYRGDKGRSRQVGGTGLGLAIARKLVEAHGGTISAGNRPEGGAIFSVEIPPHSS